MSEEKEIIRNLITKADLAILDIRHGRSSETRNESTLLAAQATIDALYFVTDGNLWKTFPILSINIGPNEQFFPYGTHINFVSIYGSNEKDFRAAFTLTKSVTDQDLGAFVYIEGKMTNNGTQITFMCRNLVEMNEEQSISGLAAFANNLAIDKMLGPQ